MIAGYRQFVNGSEKYQATRHGSSHRIAERHDSCLGTHENVRRDRTEKTKRSHFILPRASSFFFSFFPTQSGWREMDEWKTGAMRKERMLRHEVQVLQHIDPTLPGIPAWAVTALSSSRGERWLARSSFVGHEARVFVMDGRHDVHILERPCQRSREGGKKNKRLYLQVYTMGSEHEAVAGGKSERVQMSACELVTR